MGTGLPQMMLRFSLNTVQAKPLAPPLPPHPSLARPSLETTTVRPLEIWDLVSTAARRASAPQAAAPPHGAHPSRLLFLSSCTCLHAQLPRPPPFCPPVPPPGKPLRERAMAHAGDRLGCAPPSSAGVPSSLAALCQGPPDVPPARAPSSPIVNKLTTNALCECAASEPAMYSTPIRLSVV
jgi:hypothetical protein